MTVYWITLIIVGLYLVLGVVLADSHTNETEIERNARLDAEEKVAMLQQHWQKEIARFRAEYKVGLISLEQLNEKLQIALAELNNLDIGS